jgi:transcriptional regulator EpsA
MEFSLFGSRCAPHAFASADFAPESDDTIAEWAAAEDALLLESLMFNLDASLRIHARPQFYCWTQGLLQSLINHEVLVCALRDGESLSFRTDCFSTIALDSTLFGELFLRDPCVMPGLVKAWEELRFRPVICDISNGVLARELEAIGATRLLAHGTHDAEGQVTGFFTFACRPGTAGPRQAYLLQLVAPSLHAAWVRSQIEGPTTGNEKPAWAKILTSREQEILHWIRRGKSNFEIGRILMISPLTVKNHVQKILRKLNAVNRTQAIGKAMELRILNP